MAIAEVSIVPIGTADTSVSKYVAGCVEVLRQSGLRHRLTPMGTVVEGDIMEVMAVIQRMHESGFDSGVGRVYTVIKIDDRRDKSVDMMDKVTSVETKMNRDPGGKA